MISREATLRPEVNDALCKLSVPVIRVVSETIPGLHPEKEKNKCINIAKARNEVRRKALQTNCTHFLFIDDDVVVPPHTIGALTSHGLSIVGGWFPMRNPSFWTGGLWVGGGQHFYFAPYTHPQPGLIKTDLISMGCCLLSRSILERFEFRPGVDSTCLDIFGRRFHLADSGDFSYRLLQAGIQPHLDGSVICQHLCH